MTRPALGFLLLVGLLWVGCTPEPKPIGYGEDNCAYCRMTVTDPRYGSELVTSTGKTYMFDSIECLAAYVEENPDVEVHSLWVPNFRDPGTLMNVEEAFLVRSDQLKSPMSLNIAAFRSSAVDPGVVADSVSGTVISWKEVRSLVRREWIESPQGGPGGMRGAHRHRMLHHRGDEDTRPLWTERTRGRTEEGSSSWFVGPE